MDDLIDIYERNIDRMNDGVFYSVRCKKGLWSAHGSVAGAVAVEVEARHYFVQYLSDGEYE